MIITGSALFIEPGTSDVVRKQLAAFSEVTIQAESESRTELVINLEAENHGALEDLCRDLKKRIPEIVEVSHFYVNFEEEVEKVRSGRSDGSTIPKPEFQE